MTKKINILLLTGNSTQLKNFIKMYKRIYENRKSINIKAIGLKYNKDYYLEIPFLNITKKREREK